MAAGAPDTVETFAQDLTDARREAGLSVRDVARETGIPSATLGGYFAGRHLPPANRPEVLLAVLRACGVPAAEHPAWRRRLVALHDRRRRPAVTRTPYPGLRPFGEEDHDLFFGREDLVERLLTEVAEAVPDPAPVVVVVGPSGAGKSSLLRAGLIAAMPGDRCVLRTPTQLDDAPAGTGSADRRAEGLTDRQDGPRGPRTDGQAERQADGRADRRADGQADGRAEPPPGPVQELLVVDQLEELWTHPELRARAHALLEEVLDRADGAAGRVVVLGLRADFYGQAMLEPRLAHALRHRQVLVEPLGAEQMRAAIEGPARRVGLTLEPGLVDVILADVRDDPVGSTLPHLAHVLDTMWGTSDRRSLTIEDYRRAGGFEGAIRQSAERALTSLPAEHQGLAMTMLLQMVTTAAQGWTRRLVPTEELRRIDDDARHVLDHLVARRLVTVRTHDATLSHESLVGAWPRLEEAVEARRGDLARRDTLDRGATDWDRDGRGEDHLLRGTRLAATAEWATTLPTPLTPLQQDFLDASRRLDDRLRAERRAGRRRRQAALAVLAALLLVATTTGLLAVRASGEARTERDQAQARQMAVAAASVRSTHPALSQQLAVAAERAADTRESRSAVLDATTSPVVTSWSLQDAVLERAATLSDGEHLVLAGPEGGVRVVRPTGATGWEVVATVEDLGQGAATPSVTRLVAHPDRPWLAVAGTATRDGDDPVPLLALLDLSDPSAPGVSVLDVAARPTAAAFVAGGSRLVVADETGELHGYRVPAAGDAGPPRTLAEVEGLVEGLAAARDGSVLAAALDTGEVVAWEVVDDGLEPAGRHQTGRGLFDLDMTADGSAVAAVGRSGLVHWLELGGTVTETGVSYASDTNLFAVEIDDEGGLLTASGWDGSASVWRVDETGPLTESPALVLPVARPVLDVATLQDRWLFATLGGTTYTWDAVGPTLPRLPGNVFLVDATAEGDRYMTSTGPPDGAVTVWDASDPHAPAVLHTVRVAGDDTSTGAGAISPDGARVAIGTAGGRLVVWDVSADEPREVVDAAVAPDGVVLVAFVAGTDDVLAFGRDGVVARVATEGPERGRVLDETTLDGAVFSATVRDDGLLVVSDDTGDVTVAHVDDLGTALTTFSPGANVYGLDFSPDGATLALSLGDNTVRLYDVDDPAAPEPLGDPLTGPTAIPNSVKYSPDGRRLAVAAIDGRAWIWTATEDGWAATEVLRAGLDNLQDVTWSADGSVLLGAGLSGRTRLWLTDVDAAAAQLCAGVGQDVTAEEWSGLLPGVPYEPPCGRDG